MISMILTEEIFQETYIVRRLKIKESVKSFDCGDTDLNDFILNESLLYRKALLAVSYVVEDKKIIIGLLPISVWLMIESH